MLLLVVIDPPTPAVGTPDVPITPPEPSTGIIVADGYQEPSVPRWRDRPMSGPTFAYEYVTGAELPTLHIPWSDFEDSAIDFSNGYAFTLFVGHIGELAIFAKTAGISGSVGAIDIAWSPTAGQDLNLLEPGRYNCMLRARRTSDSADRKRLGEITILAGILE